jgi:hypothetical protein
MRFRFLTRTPGVLFALAALLGAPVAATAQVADPPGFGLGITPTRVVIPPDQLLTPQTIRVVNIGASPLNVVVQTSDFTADRSGAIILRQGGPNSATTWISVDVNQFTLAPNESRHVTFRVTAPDAPEPGDHQAAIVFLVPGTNDGNIQVNRGIAAPVYVTVPGAIDTTATVEEFRAPSFATGGPITLSATLRANGNVHRDFRGPDALTATMEDGRTVAFTDFTVLRGAIADATATWQDPPAFCVCRLTISISNDGVVSQRTISVVIFPLYQLLAGLAVLVVAAIVALVYWRWQQRNAPTPAP